MDEITKKKAELYDLIDLNRQHMNESRRLGGVIQLKEMELQKLIKGQPKADGQAEPAE